MAAYKIVIDSCGELTETMKKDGHFTNVALELMVDDYCIADDENFNQEVRMVHHMHGIWQFWTVSRIIWIRHGGMPDI